MHLSPQDQRALRQSLRVYRLASPLAVALLVPGVLKRMIRRGGYQRHFGQRFGRFEPKESRRLEQHRWTWIRSISVGETLVALKLAKALHTARPDIRIALSITTSTGFALAAEAASDWLFPFYNPIDTQSAVDKVLSLLRPERLILIEGELWPNLMVACLERNIPVMLANARLSPRSAARFAKFKHWTAPFFRLLEWVGIPDEEDRPRWESIGLPHDRLHLTGSIKFDQDATVGTRAKEFALLLKQSGKEDDAPLWVAGSTHDGEEELLVKSLLRLRERHPTLQLAIAPRHVERIPHLLKMLAPLNTRITLRSGLSDGRPWDVLLLDTTGELRDWYALATVAFVGKSLTAIGGQNPVEPALAGKPVVFGPHMENFAAVVRLLLEAQGAIQVESAEALEATVTELLKSPAKREALGQNALSALGRHQGATLRTTALVLETRS